MLPAAALLVAGPVLIPAALLLIAWVMLSRTMLSTGTDIRAMKSREQRRAENREQSRGENIVSPVHVYARMQGKRKAAYQEAAAWVRCGWLVRGLVLNIIFLFEYLTRLIWCEWIGGHWPINHTFERFNMVFSYWVHNCMVLVVG